MICRRILLTPAQQNPAFIDYLKAGTADAVRRVYGRRSKKEKALIASHLKELCKRYRLKSLSPEKYLAVLISSLEYGIRQTGILTVTVSPKHKYLKVIKSIELGSLGIKAVPVLGKVLAVMHSLADRLYTDYEEVCAKLEYLRVTNTMRYKILSRHSLYSIRNRLLGRVRLL